MAIEPVITLFRIRVVATFNSGNKEITNDLPHLHQSHYEVVGFQPGNPGSSTLGSFSIKLHPPGTEGYAAAKPIYDQLDYIQRVELYGSPDGASLGRLYYAGVVTGIRKGYGQNPVFELTGVSDLFWANYSRPFPGEVMFLPTSPGSYSQAHAYFGTNEPGLTDTFNPFTAANYTSTNLPGLTAGAWSSTTDDGLNVVSCATGTGAVLISKTGAIAQDTAGHQFVEITGRIKPAALDATNGGSFGIGLSLSGTDCNNAMLAYVTVVYNVTTGRYDCNLTPTEYISGTQHAGTTLTGVLSSAEDPEGFVPLTLSFYHDVPIGGTAEQATAVVNGKTNQTIAWPLSLTASNAATMYPVLHYRLPASGTATVYMGNLVQGIRYCDDKNSGTAVFRAGTIGSPAHSLPAYTDPGPTFLEVWSRAATREGWYWRYTPQPYVVGTRTLGTVDFNADPGTDRGTNKQIVFTATDNLVDLQLTANTDQIAAGTALSSVSGTDGGGVGYWRDIGTMLKYGFIEDQVLGVTAPNFTEQRKGALNIVANRITLSSAGSKTAIVLRDPQTADVWRELDKVMIHDPEMGINYLVARVIGYTFDEGQSTQALVLDQFSVDDPTVWQRRLQQGVFQISGKFGNR